MAPRRRMVLRTRRKSKVHQVGDGPLSLSTICGPHDGLYVSKAVNNSPRGFSGPGNATTMSMQGRVQGHIQSRYTQHHPTAEVSAACVDSSDLGCFWQKEYSSTSVQLQSSRTPLGAVGSHCQWVKGSNGMSQRKTNLGYSRPWKTLKSALDWTTFLDCNLIDDFALDTGRSASVTLEGLLRVRYGRTPGEQRSSGVSKLDDGINRGNQGRPRRMYIIEYGRVKPRRARERRIEGGSERILFEGNLCHLSMPC